MSNYKINKLVEYLYNIQSMNRKVEARYNSVNKMINPFLTLFPKEVSHFKQTVRLISGG